MLMPRFTSKYQNLFECTAGQVVFLPLSLAFFASLRKQSVVWEISNDNGKICFSNARTRSYLVVSKI